MIEFFKTIAALVVLILVLGLFESCTNSTKKSDQTQQEMEPSLGSISLDDYAVGAGVFSATVANDIIASDTGDKSSMLEYVLIDGAWHRVILIPEHRGGDRKYYQDIEGVVYSPYAKEAISSDYRFMYLADSAFVARFEVNPTTEIQREPEEEYSPAFRSIVEEAKDKITALYDRPIEAIDVFAIADKGDLRGFYGSFAPEGKNALGFIAIELEGTLYLLEDPAEIGEYGTWGMDDGNKYAAPILQGYLTDKDGQVLFLLTRPRSEGLNMNYYTPVDGKLCPLTGEGWEVYPF